MKSVSEQAEDIINEINALEYSEDSVNNIIILVKKLLDVAAKYDVLDNESLYHFTVMIDQRELTDLINELNQNTYSNSLSYAFMKVQMAVDTDCSGRHKRNPAKEGRAL